MAHEVPVAQALPRRPDAGSRLPAQPHAGLALLADLDPDLPRFAAVAAHLRERAGELERAAQLYADAAGAASSAADRDRLIREAARVRQLLRSPSGGP